MTVAALGEKKLGEYVENRFDLTTEAFEYINKLDRFKCAIKPQSNILCFRIEGNDDLQLKIRNKLTAEGDFYISTTSFNGLRYMRLSIMNPDTSLNDIKNLVQRIREVSQE